MILGGQSLGAITTLATINADPGRYDGFFANEGNLADPAKYEFTYADVDHVVADALVFGNLGPGGLLAEMQGTLGNLGVNPISGSDHVVNLGAFTGHAVLQAGERASDLRSWTRGRYSPGRRTRPFTSTPNTATGTSASVRTKRPT